MSNNTHQTRRELLAQLGTLSGMGILVSISVGCGGSDKSLPNTSSSRAGDVQLKITWPSAPTSRYIPAYAKSLVFVLYKQDNPAERYTLVANRPDTLPATQSVTFRTIPIGAYVLEGVARVDREGQGATVSSASTPIQIRAGETTRAELTLNSTIRSVEILGQPLKVTVGDALTLTGRALDPDNKVILLPSGALTWSQLSGTPVGMVTSEGRLTTSAAGVIRVRLAEPVTNVGAEADIQVVAKQGLATSAWPKFRGDAKNTGRGGGSGAVGVKKWEFVAGLHVSSSPAIGSDGTVYFGSWDINFYALDGATGAKKWEIVNPCFTSSPSIGFDGTVYIGSNDFGVYALDGATGTTKWQFIAVGGFSSSPAIGSDGTIYIGTIGSRGGGQESVIYALDGATGIAKWSRYVGGQIFSSPAIGSDGTVYFGCYDGKVYAFDGATGAKKWEFQTQNTVRSSPAIGSDGTVYVGSADGKVYALDGATGTKKWEFLTGNYVLSSPAIGFDGTVYIGSYDFKVYALDGATGAKKWEFLTGAEIQSSPVIGSDGTVYIGSNDFKVYALDGVTGTKKWEFLTGNYVSSSPAIGSDGTIYVGGLDNKFYAIR
jgi:outer membrane protein assembly factor BamB